MSAKPPQVLSRKTNGAAQASASQSSEAQEAVDGTGVGSSAKGKKAANDRPGAANKNMNEPERQKQGKAKASNEGEKLVIRRLPPGLTRAELLAIIGEEWDVGKGRVDWLYFAPGKVSADLAKPSRPGRAYIHVVKKDDIMMLGDVVRNSTWEDAKGTFNNSSLVGPPSLEFSVYKKIPSNKKRTDTRQGTIDQDPEFMAFLEELANPTPARENLGAENGDETGKSDTKVTTTPLVEYLKEKRANKGKDKKSKQARQDEANSKGKGTAKDEDSGKKKGKGSKEDKSHKGPKETVKILTKKEATDQAADAAKNVAAQISVGNAADNPKTRRAGIAAAARILQRDLGLSPGSAHRRARQDAAKADTDTKPKAEATKGGATKSEVPASVADDASQTPSRPATPIASKAPASGRKTRGGKNAEKGKGADTGTSQPQASASNPPVILKKKPEPSAPQSSKDAVTPPVESSEKATKPQQEQKSSNKNTSQRKSATVAAGATRSFIKHANASQGVTEASLRSAMEGFGAVTSIEMDKRKGFAYVDFADHESLVKAVNASPVAVAQANVQVLERKERKPNAAPAKAEGSSSAGTANSEKNANRGRRGRVGGGGGGKGNAGSSAASQSQTAAATTTNGSAG